MMKISQKRLAIFVDILRALVPECRLMITSDGINVLAVDTANVAMVQANLSKESFEEYSEGTVEIGMDVEKWETLLGIMSDPKSTITITRYPTDSRIRFFDGKWDDIHTPLDPSAVRKRPNQPGFSLPATVVIDAKEFSEIIRAMSVIGDKVRITTNKEGLTFDTEGDMDRLHKSIPGKEGGKFTAVSSLFSLDYMQEIARPMKAAGTIAVHMGQDMPVRFDFEIESIECSFIIAPRLEEKP